MAILKNTLKNTLGEDKDIREEAGLDTLKQTWKWGIGPAAGLARAVFYKRRQKGLEEQKEAAELIERQEKQLAMESRLTGELDQGQAELASQRQQQAQPMESYDKIMMDAMPGGTAMYDSWKAKIYG